MLPPCVCCCCWRHPACPAVLAAHPGRRAPCKVCSRSTKVVCAYQVTARCAYVCVNFVRTLLVGACGPSHPHSTTNHPSQIEQCAIGCLFVRLPLVTQQCRASGLSPRPSVWPLQHASYSTVPRPPPPSACQQHIGQESVKYLPASLQVFCCQLLNGSSSLLPQPPAVTRHQHMRQLPNVFQVTTPTHRSHWQDRWAGCRGSST